MVAKGSGVVLLLGLFGSFLRGGFGANLSGHFGNFFRCVKLFGRDFRVRFFDGYFDGYFFGLRLFDEVDDFFLCGIFRGERWHHVAGACVSAFFIFGILVILRFCAGNRELTSHEELIVEDFDGALGFVDVDHFNETVALRAMGGAVVDDLDAADGSDAFEQLFEIALGGVVGEVAHIDAAVLDGGWIASTWAAGIAILAVVATWFAAFRRVRSLRAIVVSWIGTWLTWFTRFARLTWFASVGACVASLVLAWFAGLLWIDNIRPALWAWWTDGFFVESKDFFQLLPKTQLGRSRHRTALRFSGVLAALATFAFATAGLAAVWLASFGVATFGLATFGLATFGLTTFGLTTFGLTSFCVAVRIVVIVIVAAVLPSA